MIFRTRYKSNNFFVSIFLTGWHYRHFFFVEVGFRYLMNRGGNLEKFTKGFFPALKSRKIENVARFENSINGDQKFSLSCSAQVPSHDWNILAKKKIRPKIRSAKIFCTQCNRKEERDFTCARKLSICALNWDQSDNMFFIALSYLGPMQQNWIPCNLLMARARSFQWSLPNRNKILLSR